MDLLSQQPLLSTDEATRGFDRQAGNRWIYPENYPIRTYQFTIVKTALFNNTLVCLPTGLGKTFIAAVVMYNYFRWYPKGIIVFLAPTKPLVAQQIEACHDIMGIPISDTTELTGATNPAKRHASWREHRVIFATPQTFQKDLENNIIPTDLVKCIVIDEAHKALGKHAYCESVKMMYDATPYFRILALSATPGGKLEAVQDVIRNLHITHLELRDDTSPDIVPYINERKLDIILVELGNDLLRFKERYIQIMDRHVKILQQNNVLKTYAANISKGRIFHILNDFKSRQNKVGNHGVIMRTLNILLTMYHGYELLIRHGLRAFINFYQNHSDKYWLNNEHDLQELICEITEFIGPFPDVKSLVDGITDDIPENIVFGHAKFNKLREILQNHFESAENKENTRAIVFIEYRDIVNEVFVLLMKSRPLIRPQIFVGQAGLKQKAQKKALDDFRNNRVNVLISTSVGEEGLDVGEVDLIVCFDISQQSPTRLVQRMGRTGRKRNGHIIVLVTDGKEHQTLQSALFKKNSLNSKVLQSSGVISALQSASPRMIPVDIVPECQKIHMTVLPKNYPGLAAARRSKKILENPAASEKSGTKSKKSTKSTKNQKDIEEKSGGTLMKYFQAIPNDDNENDDDLVPLKIQETRFLENISQKSISQPLHCTSALIRPSDVKLLTSDNETLEFLTLCATRQSEKDNNRNDEDKNLNIPYLSESSSQEESFFDSIQIPKDDVLNCLDSLTMFIKPPEDAPMDDVYEIYTAKGFTQNCQQYSSPPEVYVEMETRFEDLLNTSESDVEANANDDESPPLEIVDWSKNYQEKHEKKLNNDGREVNVEELYAFENILWDVSDGENSASPDTSPYKLQSSQISSKICQISTNNRNTSTENLQISSRLTSSKTITECTFEHLLDDSEDSNETQFDFDPEVFDKQMNAIKTVDHKEVKDCRIDKNEDQNIAWMDSMDFPADQLSLQILYESISKNDNKQDTYEDGKSVNPVLKQGDEFSITSEKLHNLKNSTKLHEQNNKINNQCNSQEVNRLAVSHETKNRANDDGAMAMEIDEVESFDFFSEIPKRSQENQKCSTACKESTKSETATEKFQKSPRNFSPLKKSMINQMESIEFFPTLYQQSEDTARPSKSSEKAAIIEIFNENSKHATSLDKPKIHEPESYDFFTAVSEPRSQKPSISSKEKSTQFEEIDLTGLDEDDFDFWNSSKSLPQTSQLILNAQSAISKTSNQINHTTTLTDLPSTSYSSSNHSSSMKDTGITNSNKKSQDSIQYEALSLQSPVRKFQQNHRLNLANLTKKIESKTRQNDIKEIICLKKVESKTCENKRISQLKSNSTNTNEKTEEKSAMDADVDNSLDDYEWGSDFEASEVITESNYFGSSKANKNQKGNFNKHSKGTFKENLKDKTETFKQSETKIQNKFQSKPHESTLTPIQGTSSGKFSGDPIKPASDRSKEDLEVIRRIVFAKPQKKFIPQSNSDSDDDFSQTKIKKSVFNGYNNTKFQSAAKRSDLNYNKHFDSKNSEAQKNNLSNGRSDDCFSFKKPDLSAFSLPKRPQLKATGSDRPRIHSSPSHKRKKSAKRRDRIKSDFIDDEAEVSSDDENHFDSNSSSKEDGDLSGFISHTQYHDDSVDMKAHYLQSTRSPKKRNGFLLRKPKSPPVNVFSQTVLDETDSYLHDSFCVQEDEDGVSDGDVSPQEITIAEEVVRKKRKRSGTTERRRRKRIQVQGDSSSDDETERMRADVMEASMVLKKSL